MLKAVDCNGADDQPLSSWRLWGRIQWTVLIVEFEYQGYSPAGTSFEMYIRIREANETMSLKQL